METKSGTPIILKYGLILSLALIALSLITSLLFTDVNNGSNMAGGIIGFLLNGAISIAIMVMGAKLRRDQDLEGNMSYGKALGFMMAIAIPATFIVGVYNIVYTQFINPEQMAKIIEAQADAMSQKGMSDEEIDRAMGVMRTMQNPLWGFIAGTFVYLFFFLVYALIGAIFVQKQPKTFE